MSDGMPYADIVILALIAGFVLLRLRGVLGQKIGQDTPPPHAEPKGQDAESPIVQLAEKAARLRQQPGKDEENQLLERIEDPAAREAVQRIKKADREFSLQNFLKGARMAFEMGFDAFMKDDRETLKMLLSPALYEVFSSELDARKDRDTYTETTLLSVVSEQVARASLEKNVARIAVRFVSEQVSVERGKDGKIVQGNPADSEHAENEWTFERDVTSGNPNWRIIDT